MRRYLLDLSGVRPVTARAVILASSAEEAKVQALELAGDLDWDCDEGTVDLRIEAVREIPGETG